MTTERLGKYEIRGTLGKGAMGTVYSAWDPIISRTVAIKTVRLPDAADIDAQEELARFKREAQAAGRLTHPNIVGIFDYGETDAVAYIVMEFVDGRTLKSVMDAEERMPVATVGKIMADVLAGLHYSHDKGVVHRDIKPANVMIVGGDGHGSGQAKIADFGIARIESSNLTQAGTIMGTPAYMSPEQFMGQTVDSRTDIYSAGVLLFQLLTGERPFEGSMATIMHKALNTTPPRPSELSVTAPVALDAVVSRAMARRPDDRYPNAAAFAGAITAALEGRAAPPPENGLGQGLGDLDSESTVVRPAATRQAAPVTAASAPTGSRPRSKTAVLAGAAVLLLGGGGAGAAWWLGMFNPPVPPNPQVAASTRVVTPQAGGPVAAGSAASGAGTVVAVAPPRMTASASPPPAATPAASVPTPPPAPTPRADVTQVVPPSTSQAAGHAEPPPAPTRAAEIIPPAAATRQTAIAAGPPLEPARVAPPPSATVPPPVETRSVTGRPEIPASMKPEPAVVTPPQAATVASAAVVPSEPARMEPAPIVPVAPPQAAPITAAAPPQARSPEPATVAAAAPSQAVVPPETPVAAAAPTVAAAQTTTPAATTPAATTPAATTPAATTPAATTPAATAPAAAAPVATVPAVTAAIVTPEAIRRAVTSAVRGADCAIVQGDLSSAGTLVMQGVVGGGPPTQDLLRRVRDAAPTAPLDWSVEEANGPYCGVLNLVHAYARPFGNTAGGLEVGLEGGRNHLLDRDKFQIHAEMPGFRGYFELDYFSSDGSVFHARTAAPGSPAVAAHSVQTYDAEVGPPFGTDLIVAIASSAPLFGRGEKLSEEAEPYLRQLRGAIAAAANHRASLAAGAYVVHTSPKP